MDPHKELFAAIKNDEHERVRALVAEHPTILEDASRNGGATKAVGYAVEKLVYGGSCSVEMVATLCDLGADVNGRGSDTADTPLFMAACYPNPHMERLVRLLLERGANPQLKNIDQRTAAEECANEEVRSMILQAIADPLPPYVPPAAPAPMSAPPQYVLAALPPPAPAPQPSPPLAPKSALVPAAAPAAAVTKEEWARVDRLAVRERSRRLMLRLAELGATSSADVAQSRVKLADFEILGDKIGDGANAFVYLARCRPDGQLADHTDIIVVLKVLHHYKQPGGMELAATSSVLDRQFMQAVRHEAKGPNMKEIRDNIVHVLGTFIDDASSLREYREMIANLGVAGIEVDATTGFFVMPWFSGGDLCKCIAQKRESGESFSEGTILEYMSQILDAIQELQRVGNTHRDLRPANVFLTGGADGVAIADFGELSDVQLRFTKGEMHAGGAPACIAPDVLERIARMEDGTTATIDYSKNDVFAAGLICYKMVLADNYAEPWDEGAPKTAETMRRIPDGRCSDGLRTLIDDMLNPSFTARVDAQSASGRVVEMQYIDRPGGARWGTALIADCRSLLRQIGLEDHSSALATALLKKAKLQEYTDTLVEQGLGWGDLSWVTKQDLEEAGMKELHARRLVLHIKRVMAEGLEEHSDSDSDSDSTVEVEAEINCTSFVGLKNHGATSYMNSLVQALYMTPEFRRALYRWQWNARQGESKKGSISYQLQKLFCLLNTKTEAVDTEQLTASVGWTAADAFQQHDVSELFDIICDSLENSCRSTTGAAEIKSLFVGHENLYLRCEACGFKSSRNDEFNAVSIPVKQHGDPSSIASIEEGLNNYYKSERMCGDNQWYCEHCKTKVNAEKGVIMSTVPYILAINLQRFVFDWTIDQEHKLGDKVSFPETLDVARYLDGTPAPSEESLADETRHNDFGKDGSSTLMRGRSAIGLKLPDTLNYDLYAILVHQGQTTTSGHYYAYIRDFEENEWFEFNDEEVTGPLDSSQWQQAFGGYTHNTSGYKVAQDTAYMLMYRRRDPAVNIDSVPDIFIPQHVLTDIAQEGIVASRDNVGCPSRPPTSVLRRTPLISETAASLPTATELTQYGISVAGLDYALNRFRVTDDMTTSDVCHRHIRPETVPTGWRDDVKLIDPDQRWYEHRYFSMATNTYQKHPPAGTQSLCEYYRSEAATAKYVGSPTIFLSHAWKYKYRELLQTLREFQASLPGADEGEEIELFFWFDCFCVNQHVGQDLPKLRDACYALDCDRDGTITADQLRQVVLEQRELSPAKVDELLDITRASAAEHNTGVNYSSFIDAIKREWWGATFKQSIKQIGHTLMVLSPWNAPVTLKRAWCLWEVFCSVETGTYFDVLLGETDRIEFERAVQADFNSVDAVVRNVDIMQAEAGDPNDLMMIKLEIEEFERRTNKQVNEVVRSTFLKWMKRYNHDAVALSQAINNEASQERAEQYKEYGAIASHESVQPGAK